MGGQWPVEGPGEGRHDVGSGQRNQGSTVILLQNEAGKVDSPGFEAEGVGL